MPMRSAALAEMQLFGDGEEIAQLAEVRSAHTTNISNLNHSPIGHMDTPGVFSTA